MALEMGEMALPIPQISPVFKKSRLVITTDILTFLPHESDIMTQLPEDQNTLFRKLLKKTLSLSNDFENLI
jgi:hypothetical protein